MAFHKILKSCVNDMIFTALLALLWPKILLVNPRKKTFLIQLGLYPFQAENVQACFSFKLPSKWLEEISWKSHEVPLHGIISPYSYFEVIWIFAPIQQEAKHDQEKLSAEQKWKVCCQSPAMFCLFYTSSQNSNLLYSEVGSLKRS